MHPLRSAEPDPPGPVGLGRAAATEQSSEQSSPVVHDEVDASTPEQFPLEMLASIIGDTARVAVTGEVDHHTSRKLRSVLRGVLALGVRSVVLDCSGVTFIDAGGLNAIAELRLHVDDRQGTVTIRSPSATMRRLLTIVGIDALVTIT
jgi:anti-anti-sigma factor